MFTCFFLRAKNSRSAFWIKYSKKKKKKSCYIGKNHKLSEEIENGLKFCPKMSVGI